jgi:hypothetical protein
MPRQPSPHGAWVDEVVLRGSLAPLACAVAASVARVSKLKLLCIEMKIISHELNFFCRFHNLSFKKKKLLHYRFCPTSNTRLEEHMRPVSFTTCVSHTSSCSKTSSDDKQDTVYLLQLTHLLRALLGF